MTAAFLCTLALSNHPARLMSSINATTLDSVRARYPTALLAPGVRGVYPDKSEEALDRVEKEGGKVFGRDSDAEWSQQLRDWLED